jgi:uncharacterized protein (DUF362 family)
MQTRVIVPSSTRRWLASVLEESGIPWKACGHVVVKPNWVQEAHEYKPDVWAPVITDPDLLLAVVTELVHLLPTGAVISVCDAPHSYASFAGIVSRGGFADRLARLATEHPKTVIELLDLRREVWTRRDGVVVARHRNTDDPRGYVAFDLAADSMFAGHNGTGRYYGADYDAGVVNRHHTGGRHEYLLAGTPIRCDAFVNVPKLKTHKKTGITCSLKNLVGINGDKNWLPHHTQGSPASGGDEYPALGMVQQIEQIARRAGRAVALRVPHLGPQLYRRARSAGTALLGDSESTVRNGNWHGNDTTWRMALDLNRALLFGNPTGSMRPGDPSSRKHYLSIVDGVIGGEGNGPLCPDPVESEVIIAGTDPAAVDATCAQLMGFPVERLPLVRNAFGGHRWPISLTQLEDVMVNDDRVGGSIGIAEVTAAIAGGFRPHFGWDEHLRG